MATRRKPKTVDMSLLTEADKRRIEDDAEIKVAAEYKLAAEREYLAQVMDDERAKHDPTLEMVEVLIDIPAFANCLTVDGSRYYHGDVREVTASKAASMREQMARMWEQEKISGNPNMKDYKPVKHDAFSAKSGETVHGFSRV